MTHPERLPVPDDVLGAGADGAGGLVLDVDLDEHRPREDEVEVQAQVTLAQNHAPLVAPRTGEGGLMIIFINFVIWAIIICILCYGSL